MSWQFHPDLSLGAVAPMWRPSIASEIISGRARALCVIVFVYNTLDCRLALV